MKIQQPFHSGEIQIQELFHERDTALLNGRLYEDSVMVAAHKFLASLHFFVVSVETDFQKIPVSILFGEPGFVSIDESGKRVTFSLKMHTNKSRDSVLNSLAVGSRIGGLGIELSTRRRLRINGRVEGLSDNSMTILVNESYPNCPKYITKRVINFYEDKHELIEDSKIGAKLLEEHLKLIKSSDMFFVSSLNPEGNADVSHRGGAPGFVEVLESGILRIPDYLGNSLYNTLGNFAVNPKAGLLFWDFKKSELLHIYGDILFDFQETGRWWMFVPESWKWQRVKMPFELDIQRS